MRKIFAVLPVFLLIFSCCLAQETLTISTYYPSPYGVYNELRINPNDDAHTCSSANEEGTMYYDLSEHKMKICDYQSGSYAWRDLDGAGGYSYTYFCYSSTFFGTPVCNNAGGTRGYCPAGYTQKYDLGAWGWCFSSAAMWHLPPGNNCPTMFSGLDVTKQATGNAYVCSQ